VERYRFAAHRFEHFRQLNAQLLYVVDKNARLQADTTTSSQFQPQM